MAIDLTLPDADGELPPPTVTIAHDSYHASFVGTTNDGQQFFLTEPFSWPVGDAPGTEFVARYLFDAGGALVDSTVVPLGRRPTPSGSREAAIERLLTEISPVTYEDIAVAPFTVTHHGETFGLILHGPDLADTPEDEWYWSAIIEPGDYMSFSAPWDDGDYDT